MSTPVNSSTRTGPEPAKGAGTGRLRKPPKVIMRLANPLMRLLLRSPFHGRLSGVILLLTFTGRKSGKQITTPVGYQRQGDTLLVFTHSPWWKNLRGGAPVMARVKGKDLQGWAVPAQDPEEVLPIVEELLRKNGVGQARRIGLNLDGTRMPGREELRAAIQGLVVIRITAR